METKEIRIHNGEVPQMPGTIRFVCLSDTHGKTSYLNVPNGDVLLHSGDFSSMGEERDIVKFNSFLASLQHREKIVIAGNHDLTFDLENQNSLKNNFYNLVGVDAEKVKGLLKDCTYLEDSECYISGYKVYGSPWTPTFFDWAFNLDRGQPISEKWEIIPSDTDILITHGPPKGILDRCYDGFSAGCEDLLNKIHEIKPLVHLFGHIHEGYGAAFDGTTNYINASICTLRYQPSNKPWVFDLYPKN
jgi:Icc-related predicted phosphoesterase